MYHFRFVLSFNYLPFFIFVHHFYLLHQFNSFIKLDFHYYIGHFNHFNHFNFHLNSFSYQNLRCLLILFLTMWEGYQIPLKWIFLSFYFKRKLFEKILKSKFILLFLLDFSISLSIIWSYYVYNITSLRFVYWRSWWMPYTSSN